MEALIRKRRAPRHAVIPKHLDRDALFSLDIDDPIWNDRGLGDEDSHVFHIRRARQLGGIYVRSCMWDIGSCSGCSANIYGHATLPCPPPYRTCQKRQGHCC